MEFPLFPFLPADIRKNYLPIFFSGYTLLRFLSTSTEYWKLKEDIYFWRCIFSTRYQFHLIELPIFPLAFYIEALLLEIEYGNNDFNWMEFLSNKERGIRPLTSHLNSSFRFQNYKFYGSVSQLEQLRFRYRIGRWYKVIIYTWRYLNNLDSTHFAFRIYMDKYEIFDITIEKSIDINPLFRILDSLKDRPKGNPSTFRDIRDSIVSSYELQYDGESYSDIHGRYLRYDAQKVTLSSFTSN